MRITTLQALGVRAKLDSKGNPIATIAQLRSWCELVSPYIHLGSPIPYEVSGHWWFPYMPQALRYEKEEDCIIDFLQVLILHKQLSINRINETLAPTTNTSEKTLLIGIDAGAQERNCGVAFYSLRETNTALVWLHSCNVFQLIRMLEDLPDKGRVGVVIEDPNCQSSTFLAEGKMSLAYAAKLGQGVGKVMGAAIFIIQALEALRIDFVRVNPSNRTNVEGNIKPNLGHYLPTKSSAAYFSEYSLWQGSSNEHERDAATLVCSRTWEAICQRANIDNQPKVWGGRGKRNTILLKINKPQ